MLDIPRLAIVLCSDQFICCSFKEFAISWTNESGARASQQTFPLHQCFAGAEAQGGVSCQQVPPLIFRVLAADTQPVPVPPCSLWGIHTLCACWHPSPSLWVDALVHLGQHHLTWLQALISLEQRA